VSGTLDDFLGGYQPPRVTVRISQRADLLARHAELQRAHAAAVRDDRDQNRNPEAPAVFDQITAVEDEIAASEFPFTFQAVGRHQYLRMIVQHKARKQDRDMQLDFNADTFPQALIAASAVEPEISLEQAEKLVQTLSDSQFGRLWQAAIAVNIGDDSAPKSVRRSSTAAPNGTSSTSAAPEESLAPSSSGE